MAGESEERQEAPALQPEPRAAVEAPTQAISNAEPADAAPVAAVNDISAYTGDDAYMSQAAALPKNRQFQRSYGMDDDGSQAKNEAKNDNGLGHAEPKKAGVSEISMGASQNNGAQMIRAGLMNPRQDTKTAAIEAQQSRARAEALRIAQWNATIISIGGVQMTNEQAQAARLNVINHFDEYAELAVKRGIIKEDEKEKLKKNLQDQYDINEAVKKRGYATPEELKKLANINAEQGPAIEKLIGASHVSNETGLSADAAFEKTYESGKAIKSELSDSRYVMAELETVASGNQATSIAKTVIGRGVKDDIDLTSDFENAATRTAVASQMPAPSEIKIARVAGATGPT